MERGWCWELILKLGFGDDDGDEDYSILSVSIRSLRPNGTAIENVIMRDPTQSHLVEKHLGGIFRCSLPILQKFQKQTNKQRHKQRDKQKNHQVLLADTPKAQQKWVSNGEEVWIVPAFFRICMAIPSQGY